MIAISFGMVVESLLIIVVSLGMMIESL